MNICIWSDGTWCWEEELEEMSHMSDDFAIADLPEWADHDDADLIAAEWNKVGVPLAQVVDEYFSFLSCVKRQLESEDFSSHTLVVIVGRNNTDMMLLQHATGIKLEPGDVFPETYKHPATHGDIADELLNCASTKGRSRCVVTHSEVLILRLMRRIREKKNTYGHRVAPDHVRILYVRDHSYIEMRLDEDGDLIDNWPGGFFEESYRETFAGR